MYQYTLVLIHRGDLYREDFLEISRRIRQLAPEILVVSIDSSFTAPLPDIVWSQPTLIVSLSRSLGIRPKRGTIYGGCWIMKDKQARLFEGAQLPTPKTAIFEVGKRLDEQEWGPLVVLKPSMINSKGLGIHLMRTTRVHELKPGNLPTDHPMQRDSYLVQSFIDTGEYPCHYRVLTFLGEPLYCRKNSRLVPRPVLTSDDDTLFNSEIATNAGAASGMSTTEMLYDIEIVKFAQRMHAAAPGIALMGCDILKEASTGKLYALEMNAGGNTWAFSSELGEAARKIIGKQAMIDQFGAWDIAARVLIQKTRQEATLDVRLLYKDLLPAAATGAHLQ